MPLFHAAGIMVFITLTLYWDTPVALIIGERPLTSDLVVEMLGHSGADSAFLPPSILEEMSRTPDGIAVLKKLNFVCFGGGKCKMK